jgi:hypothetical protein
MEAALKKAVSLLIAMAALAGAAQAQYAKPSLEHVPYEQVRIVVPITSGDASVWSFKLRNLANGFAATKEGQGQLQAHVVLYGQGVKLLQEPSASLKASIDELRAQGVRFEVCNNTLKGLDIDWHQLYGLKESEVVPSGFLEVGWLANHGWSVDPMN